jgi:hypothetical protein
VRSGIHYVEASNAERVLARVASPGLEEAAQKLAPAIIEKVPVHQGIAKARTRTSASLDSAAGEPQGRTWIDSPFWHFLEYGTQFNPPYRPIQRAAESLGLKYEAR